MAKQKMMDTAKELEREAQSLFERIKKTQDALGETLSAIRSAEGRLTQKEQQEAKARAERERAERLRELLEREDDLAFHVGTPDEADLSQMPEYGGQPAKEPAAAPPETPPVPKAEPEKAENKPPQEPERPAAAAPAPEEAAPQPEPQKPQKEISQEIPKEMPKEMAKETPQEAPKTAPQPARVAKAAAPAAPEKRVQPESSRPAQNSQRGGYSNRPQGQQRPAREGEGRPPRPQNQQRQGRDGERPQGQSTYQPRPNARTAMPGMGGGSGAGRNFDNQKSGSASNNRRRDEDRRVKSKKTIMKEAAPKITWDDDTPMGRKQRRKQQQPAHKPEPVVIEKAVLTTEMVTVKELSEKIGKPAAEIIKKLFILGIMATINQEIDFDTCSLIASEYGIELEQQLAKTAEDVLNESVEEVDAEENMVPRPPVITIMGHVDHGKTSLLDAIRESSITEGEAGGITQHIGAYTVTCNGRQITFIDTPGHEAFTSMRARGAQVTDIVILVVAADDGIMPQTVEAINHAKAAGVPIIVAINKMDKPTADPERVKQQLTEYGLVCEEWGGDTICVPVSAKTKMGLDNLLEMVLLQADVLELKANPNRIARGTIIEAELHKGRGPIATVLVQNGTLKIGDPIVAGTAYGRVRAMMDDKGRRVTEAGPSQPVEVLGFSEVPSAGDVMNVAEVDKLSRQVAEERRDKQKAEQLKAMSKVSLDDLFNQIAEGQMKELDVIVKADVQGSVEAVKQALEKLSNDEVRVKCIHGGVGAITASDIMFASASNAIVIGFNVRPDAMARETAERENVDVRTYRIIYQAIEDIEKAMKGLFAPVYKEVELGRLTVRNTFKVSGVGTIAGCYVNSGKVNRNSQIRVVRDGVVIHEGKIASLKRFKDDVKEVAAGYECGIGLENFNDIREDDVIEVYEMQEVER